MNTRTPSAQACSTVRVKSSVSTAWPVMASAAAADVGVNHWPVALV